MSKKVIYSISTRKGDWTDNVKEVNTTTTSVADQSDLDALEARINRKIETIQQSFNQLDTYLKKIAAETEKMPEEVKKEVQKLAAQQKMVLDNEYKKIVDDMAKKCADVSKILKY